MTSRRHGEMFLILILLINIPLFLLIPWENILFDKEAVIRHNSGSTVEIDVDDLEPTGVYVVMDGGNDHIIGYDDPKWIHKKVYAYAQYYLYYGDNVPERTQLYSFRTVSEDEPWVILIADSIIEIPDSGEVELDLTSINEDRTPAAERALEEVNDEYDLSQNTYIDCATPYCEELQAFKNKQKMYCVIVSLVECLLIPVILIIIFLIKKKNYKEG